MVSVVEYPATGNTFSGWYLDGIFRGIGSSITVNMTQDHQLSAFFAGNGTNPTPTPSPVPTPTSPSASNLPVPTLSFYCASSTTTSGFNVQIQGALALNNTAISGTGILFSYSATGGSTWHDLAFIITGNNGNFSIAWMPSASGNYIIKGVWPSDGIYASVSTTVNFAVAPSSQNVFSVSSNSTIASLAFDSTLNQLSFSVSGPSGTTGYVQACIPKSLMPNVSSLGVTLDNNHVVYNTFSTTDSWIITIEYSHSSHTVVMALNSASPTPTPISAPTSTATTNPTQTSNPTSSSSPNSSPTATAASPTATTTPYAPEFPPLVIVPLFILMLSLAAFVMLKKRAKANTPK
jgi:hypothetical protein